VRKLFFKINLLFFWGLMCGVGGFNVFSLALEFHEFSRFKF
jgi:hypothetical protein